MQDRAEAVRAAYAAFRSDPDRVWGLCSEDIVLHIAGDHPLSGDYVGLDAARGYVASVMKATGGRAGFSVTSVFTDDSGELLLVEGTAFHGDEPFVRTVVHLLRFDGDRVAEFWENPFDQRAEDRFWSAHLPLQRRASGAPPAAARIPAQHSPPLSAGH